jgi:hypothetical protein
MKYRVFIDVEVEGENIRQAYREISDYLFCTAVEMYYKDTKQEDKWVPPNPLPPKIKGKIEIQEQLELK